MWVWEPFLPNPILIRREKRAPRWVCLHISQLLPALEECRWLLVRPAVLLGDCPSECTAWALASCLQLCDLLPSRISVHTRMSALLGLLLLWNNGHTAFYVVWVLLSTQSRNKSGELGASPASWHSSFGSLSCSGHSHFSMETTSYLWQCEKSMEGFGVISFIRGKKRKGVKNLLNQPCQQVRWKQFPSTWHSVSLELSSQSKKNVTSIQRAWRRVQVSCYN